MIKRKEKDQKVEKKEEKVQKKEEKEVKFEKKSKIVLPFTPKECWSYKFNPTLKKCKNCHQNNLLYNFFNCQKMYEQRFLNSMGKEV